MGEMMDYSLSFPPFVFFFGFKTSGKNYTGNLFFGVFVKGISIYAKIMRLSPTMEHLGKAIHPVSQHSY
jgi:hypothetical protein